MTDLRPEREGRSPEPYVPSPAYEPGDHYGQPPAHPDAFEAAVGQLHDPLNDPLPGQRTQSPIPAPASHEQAAQAAQAAQHAGRRGSPWFRPHQQPEQQTGHQARPYDPEPAAYEPDPAAYDAIYGAGQGQGRGRDYDAGYGTYTDPASTEPIFEPRRAPVTPPPVAPAPATAELRLDEETMALRQAEEPGARHGAGGNDDRSDADDDAVSRETDAAPAQGGRAARRKAAQEAAKRGGRRGRHGGSATAAGASTAAASGSAAGPAPAPLTRLEARRAERAAKDSPSLIASRAVGEVFITLGVLMLLFVTYQLWWTNVLAEQEAGGAANTLQHEWDEGGGEIKNLSAGERFAIMYIPKLDVKAPIAEGIDKHGVLDRGMVGHYDKSSGIKTAMPWDKKGNFSVAGHRNTHGEPFRYVNKLVKGDKIIVETKKSYYTYEMESILPQTSPSNTSVIGPVPPGSGFKGPGRYITLTTCTPEFTSTYRMIVWGKMVEERPRSKGKPDALVS